MAAPEQMTLMNFLLARIAEDEAAYRDAMHLGCVEDDSDDPDVIHSATCPNRVLADCEAKRRIVDFYGGPRGVTYALRFLALPYADHADYDPEWKV